MFPDMFAIASFEPSNLDFDAIQIYASQIALQRDQARPRVLHPLDM